MAIIGIIAAVSVPGLLRARSSADEASAIASLRIVNSSQHAYMNSCGGGFYASSLTILGDPAPSGTAFISPDLASGDVENKSGYTLQMAEGSEATAAAKDGCNPSGTAANLFSSYYATNQPQMAGSTGSRWFFTNTAGAIYVDSSDAFDGETAGNKPPSAGHILQ